MKISFIVCCYNGEKRISKTLNAIFKAASQSEVNCELIVVNNCSIDNTHQIVESIINKASEIDAKLVYEANPGLMSARLRGAEEASGDYLAFIDDDNAIADNWILEAKNAINKYSSAGIIGGLAFCGYPDLPIWFEDNQQSYACGPFGREEGIINGHLNYGAGMIVVSKAWAQVSKKLDNARGFGRKSGDFGSNDDELIHILIRNQNYDIAYHPKLQLQHNLDASRLNWEHLKKMKMGFGIGFMRMNKYLVFHSGWKFWIYSLKIVKIILISFKGVILFLPDYFGKKDRAFEGNAKYLECIKSLGRLKGLFY